MHPDVQKTITQAKKLYANPSGLYREGRLAEAIDQAREHVAIFMLVSSDLYRFGY